MKKEVFWANDDHQVNHLCNQAISMLVLGIQQLKAGQVRKQMIPVIRTRISTAGKVTSYTHITWPYSNTAIILHKHDSRAVEFSQ